MKENNSPLENLEDEYKMLLLRDRIQENKWIKRLCNKTFIKHKIKVMTQEDKQLLLKDLSARLSYGAIVSVTDGTIKYKAYIESVSYKYIQVSPVSDSIFTAYTFYKISEIKPYLRPMSSMTEEEKKQFDKFMCLDEDAWIGKGIKGYINQSIIMSDGIDWLNAHHFDYRGLIEKGLAIEASEGMYNIKNKYFYLK